MKLNFKLMLCTSLLLLAVGCGKDEKKSGGQAVYPDPYLTGDSTQYFANFDSWYATQETKGHVYNVYKKTATYNTSQTCTKKWGFLYVCSFDGAPIDPIEVNEMFMIDVNKSANPELAAIASREGGALQALSATPGYNNTILLEFVKTPGIRVTYLINTNLHYRLNPVEKSVYSADGKTKTTTTISTYPTM